MTSRTGRRVDLAALAEKAHPTVTQTAADTSGAASPAPAAHDPAHPAHDASPGQWRRYDRYQPKQARLRDDQYEHLARTSRALNRARKAQGERITENTLLRIAVDLLLARDSELTGVTETELRKSLGL